MAVRDHRFGVQEQVAAGDSHVELAAAEIDGEVTGAQVEEHHAVDVVAGAESESLLGIAMRSMTILADQTSVIGLG